MLHQIQELIYAKTLPSDITEKNAPSLIAETKLLAQHAFVENNTEARIHAQQVLYQLNLAHLANPWIHPENHIHHPTFCQIKYLLENAWDLEQRQKHQCLLDSLPKVKSFSSWAKTYVQQHSSNVIHPIFTFMRDQASTAQLREFFFQETPLEMLFGDILAFMLPGVYGSIKMEYVKNYWDELGHAKEQDVHRTMRLKLMQHLNIDPDCYIKDFKLLLCEELELINLYLSLATNRNKQIELIGVMLATELMIPGRFEYQIAGWRRVGLTDDLLRYLLEHTTLDEVHAEDWLMHVVMPILHVRPKLMGDIVLGISRRLATAAAVLDKLYVHIRNIPLAEEQEQHYFLQGMCHYG